MARPGVARQVQLEPRVPPPVNTEQPPSILPPSSRPSPSWPASKVRERSPLWHLHIVLPAPSSDLEMSGGASGACTLVSLDSAELRMHAFFNHVFAQSCSVRPFQLIEQRARGEGVLRTDWQHSALALPAASSSCRMRGP